MTLFNRSASVEITTNTNFILKLTGLRFSFNVNKTENKDPNTGKVSIYNLAQDTRNIIKDVGRNVTIFAGYTDENGEELLFSGDITNITHSIKRPDVITEIEASDGKEAVDKAKIAISQNEKTNARNILQKILGEFDIGNNLNQISFADKIYQSGFAFAGLAKDALTKVTKFLNLSWSVQNNEINIVPFDGNNQTGIIFLTSKSGLLGSPERLSGKSRKAKDKSKEDKPGWKFTTLLFPSINPLGRIAVQSVEIKDITEFIVYTISHSGDTHTKEWTSSIEVRE